MPSKADMAVLLLCLCLATGAWSHRVYINPLSTQCPDNRPSTTGLLHDDVFLFDQDVSGEFPDIKRSVGQSSEHTDRKQANKPNKHRSDDSDLFVSGNPLKSSDIDDKLDGLGEDETSQEMSFVSPSPVQFEEERDVHSPKTSKGIYSNEYERRNSRFTVKNRRRQTIDRSHGQMSAREQNFNIADLEKLIPYRLHYDDQLRISNHQQDVKNRGSQRRSMRAGRSLHILQGYAMANHRLAHLTGLAWQTSKLPNSLPHSTMQKPPRHIIFKKQKLFLSSDKHAPYNEEELINEVRNIKRPFGSNSHDPKKGRHNYTDHMMSVLLFCLGQDPSYLNGNQKVKRSENVTIAQNPSNSEHSHAIVSTINSSEISKVLSDLVEFAQAYKHSILKRAIKQNNKITKRLSFIHPQCLNSNLDFVTSTNNIDADLLVFVKGLTDSLPSSVPVYEPNSMQNQDTQLQGQLRQNYFIPESLQLDTDPFLRLSKRAARFRNNKGTHRQNPAFSANKYDQASRVYRTTYGTDKQGRNSFGNTWPQSDWSRRHSVNKKDTTPQRFSQGTPLPWACPSMTRWRDLGMHVFPRYVQETSCARGSSNDDHHNTPTCWYGFYNCRPITSAVQVLVHHSGSCNDGRVPLNIRGHYFLSVVNIDTACNCV